MMVRLCSSAFSGEIPAAPRSHASAPAITIHPTLVARMIDARPCSSRGGHRAAPPPLAGCHMDNINPQGMTKMKKMTLDVETLAVDSLETGVANQDCPTASATATTSPV
jgi:hypothetical protein